LARAFYNAIKAMLEEYSHCGNQVRKASDDEDLQIQNTAVDRNYIRNVADPSATPQISWHSLRNCPPPSPTFTGRRDILAKMHAYFSSDIGKRHIFVLYGLGGVGKSEISRKFIEECQVGMNPSRYVT
jgi:hypothetical protein